MESHYAIALVAILVFKETRLHRPNDKFKEPSLTPIGLGCHICERQNCQQEERYRVVRNYVDTSKRYSGLFDSPGLKLLKPP